MKNHLNYLTSQDLRALEIAARRERAREIARLIRTGVAELRALLERLAAAAHVGGRIGHA
jgi:hypothetical protein